jgi:hypothetical protein
MAGYSATPLIKKLGYKEGQAAWLVAVPSTLSELAKYPGFGKLTSSKLVKTSSGGRHIDLVHWFVTSRSELQSGIKGVGAAMKPDAVLWISWPKKASKVRTDVTEDVLREVILPTGLVDIKVCAVDEVWSGLKFMFSKELRAGLA